MAPRGTTRRKTLSAKKSGKSVKKAGRASAKPVTLTRASLKAQALLDEIVKKYGALQVLTNLAQADEIQAELEAVIQQRDYWQQKAENRDVEPTRIPEVSEWRSEIYCSHANECPAVCECVTQRYNCICRAPGRMCSKRGADGRHI